MRIRRTRSALHLRRGLPRSRCTGFLADDAFRRSFAGRIDADETDLEEAAVTDPIQSVRRDVEKLLASSLVPSRVAVSCQEYDVDTGWSRRLSRSQSVRPDMAETISSEECYVSDTVPTHIGPRHFRSTR